MTQVASSTPQSRCSLMQSERRCLKRTLQSFIPRLPSSDCGCSCLGNISCLLHSPDLEPLRHNPVEEAKIHFNVLQQASVAAKIGMVTHHLPSNTDTVVSAPGLVGCCTRAPSPDRAPNRRLQGAVTFSFRVATPIRAQLKSQDAEKIRHSMGGETKRE